MIFFAGRAVVGKNFDTSPRRGKEPLLHRITLKTQFNRPSRVTRRTLPHRKGGTPWTETLLVWLECLAVPKHTHLEGGFFRLPMNKHALLRDMGCIRTKIDASTSGLRGVNFCVGHAGKSSVPPVSWQHKRQRPVGARSLTASNFLDRAGPQKN